MVTSTKRGHKTFYDNFYCGWFWSDDGLPIHIERSCIRCGKIPTEEGIDACIGKKLPNTQSACCGHGVNKAFTI